MNTNHISHIGFNDRWLIIMQPHRIDAFALRGQLYDRHITIKPPFSIIPWRRQKFYGIGLHEDMIWAFTSKDKQSLDIQRYTLSAEIGASKSTFKSDDAWESLDLLFYAIGPHQVLIRESHMQRWAVLRERVYHKDLVIVGLPHLSSYALVNRDGTPSPIMYNRTHLLILNKQLETVSQFDFSSPIQDAAVDRWQRTCCCLVSDKIFVIHLNTRRVIQEITLGSKDFRVIWAQDNIIGAYAPSRQIIHLFQGNGICIDRMPGDLLISDRGVGVQQNKNKVVLFSSSGIHYLESKMGQPPIGVFETPKSWILLSAPR